ncbi:MAG: DUF1214 domain-containing protein [Pelagibacterales bacterium]|nr:DUF1214 domain-containing protein [Pelagibacterales bacterium]
MIFARKYLLYFIIILIIAALETVIAIKIYPKIAFIKNDIWTILPSPGDPDRSIYTRAAVAAAGTFASKKPEQAYYQTEIDIEDQPLNGNCLYRLSGEDIESRWWSITAYANDGFLIENTEKLYSYNSETINYNANGGFEIYFLGDNDFISDVSNENWLRVNQDENFNVSLRIYYPGEEFFSNLRRVNLPIIEKVKCIE